MVEHVAASVKQERKEKLYKAYVTDALRILGENTAGLTKGKYMALRWIDLDSDTPGATDNRSGDEIAEDVIRRAGLSLREVEAEDG